MEYYNLYTSRFRGKNLNGIDKVIREAEAWIQHVSCEEDNHMYDLSNSEEIINSWHAKKLSFNDYQRISNVPSRLVWPLEIIKGAICERAGFYDMAIQNYRNALTVMPNWIPEARVTYEKLNKMRNYSSAIGHIPSNI